MGLTFRLYSYIWLVVLILYSFGWSDFSGQLDINLFFFILITVTISLIIGFHYHTDNLLGLFMLYSKFYLFKASSFI